MAGGTLLGDFDRVGVIFEINDAVARSLKFGDVAFGSDIVGIIFVDVEMIGFDAKNDSNVRGFLEIPELEAGKFVNDDGICGEAVEDVEGRDADVADEMSVFFECVKNSFNKRAGGAFAFGAGNADDGAGAMVEKVFSDGGFVLKT